MKFAGAVGFAWPLPPPTAAEDQTNPAGRQSPMRWDQCPGERGAAIRPGPRRRANRSSISFPTHTYISRLSPDPQGFHSRKHPRNRFVLFVTQHCTHSALISRTPPVDSSRRRVVVVSFVSRVSRERRTDLLFEAAAICYVVNCRIIL